MAKVTNNHLRLNGLLRFWPVVLALFGLAAGWGVLYRDVEYNAASISELKGNWRDLAPRLDEMAKSLSRIEGKLEALKKGEK